MNGVIKQWEYFNKVVLNVNIPHLEEDFRIICSIINAFRPSRCQLVKADDVERAKDMLKLSKLKINPMIGIIQRLPSNTRRVHKERLINSIEDLSGFPVLTEEYIRSITWGIYQIKQAKAYTREHIDEEGDYDCEILEPEKNLIRVKLESRHYSAKKYNVYIKYDTSNKNSPIKNWFCACLDGKTKIIKIFTIKKQINSKIYFERLSNTRNVCSCCECFMVCWC